VERGIEAGHRGNPGQLRGDRIERGQGLGLVQRGQVGQVQQLLPHAVVDHGRAGEGRPAVHDAMADHIRLRPALQHIGQPGGVEPVRPGRQVGAALDGVGGTEQAQLETRGAGVDDQYSRDQPCPAQSCSGQVQPVIAGSSSPCSRV
jgi:hypothetical protein